MLFNSYSFVLFFVAVLFATRLTFNWTARKCLLLVSSYAFYAAWNPPFVFLLFLSTFVDWVVAGKLFVIQRQGRRKALVALSLLVNLGLLGYFKYGGFFMDNLYGLLGPWGFPEARDTLNIVLPVGISFYTFQTLSYTVDVYRGNIKPCASFVDFALYVSFFPQLVAGPIVRAHEFLPQCVESKKATGQQIGWGCYLFVIGFFSKVVLADALMANTVELVFGPDKTAGFISAWTGSVAFAMQIFYDFFGYSTCAIGLALCLGFELPDNFRSPFAAKGFHDFWRRWHITLSSWIRDYVYIPLGGNRKGLFRAHAYSMASMLLCGLWHGAAWTYVAWGVIHGVFILVEGLIRETRLSAWSFWSSRFGVFFLTLSTFVLFCVSMVVFRADSFGKALDLWSPMLSLNGFSSVVSACFKGKAAVKSCEPLWLGLGAYLTVALVSSGTLIFQYKTKHSGLRGFFGSLPPVVSALVLGTLLFTILISMSGEDRAFIYFQF